jgi:hypothetical protein
MPEIPLADLLNGDLLFGVEMERSSEVDLSFLGEHPGAQVGDALATEIRSMATEEALDFMERLGMMSTDEVEWENAFAENRQAQAEGAWEAGAAKQEAQTAALQEKGKAAVQELWTV